MEAGENWKPEDEKGFKACNFEDKFGRQLCFEQSVGTMKEKTESKHDGKHAIKFTVIRFFHFIRLSIVHWHQWLTNALFAGIPEQYSTRKKIALLMENSRIGTTWEVSLIVASLIASCLYIIETYMDERWATVQWLHDADTVFTSLFTIDFGIGVMIAPSIPGYLFRFTTIIDLATWVPYYAQLAVQDLKVKLSIFRFLKIYRLLRVMRLFKSMRNLSGPKRQMIILLITMSCLILIGAGIFQMFENDVKQLMEYQCNFIGPDYQPSCSPTLTFEPDCDCKVLNCRAYYNPYDRRNQPTGVDCGALTYFQCVYFVVVTVGTLGYGDIVPTTTCSRALVIVLMMTSFVVIPLQVQELANALAAVSIYRKIYRRANEDDQHVIVCGNVNTRQKVERFLTEFYHPSRALIRDRDIKVLLLSPSEPSEGIKDLLVKEAFSGRVSYQVGSALSIDDLNKAGGHFARAVFFLSNAAVSEEDGALDDAANILRILNIMNYNSKLECYAQILRSGDGEILRQSKVDVVLCMDEFRSTMQARNAVCPGLSTLIENLFCTFGDAESAEEAQLKAATSGLSENWLADYRKGAEMEMYYIPLSPKFFVTMGHIFALVAEAIYLEYGAMLLGVCCKGKMSMILNPTLLETSVYSSTEEFYRIHDTGVLMAESYEMAEFIAHSLDQDAVVQKMIAKMILAEESCHIRSFEKDGHSIFSTSVIQATRLKAKRASVDFTAHQTSTERMNLNERLGVKSLGLGLREKGAINMSRTTDLFKALHSYKRFDSKFMDESAGHHWKRDMHRGKAGRLYSFIGHVNASCSGKQDGSMTDAAAKRERRQRTRRRASSHAEEAATGPRDEGDVLQALHDSDSSGDEEEGTKRDEKRDNRRETPTTPKRPVTNAEASAAGGQSDASRRGSSPAGIGMGVYEVRGKFGRASRMLEHATHIRGHVIIFGGSKTFQNVVLGMRGPLVSVCAYRPIVYVGESPPDDWKQISRAYDDVYWLRGNMLNARDFNRAHVKAAFSVVLLADREHLVTIDQDNLDTGALFAYLALEQHIPKEVFFTIEMLYESNISSLNSSMMPRLLAEARQLAAKRASAAALASDLMPLLEAVRGHTWFGNTRVLAVDVNSPSQGPPVPTAAGGPPASVSATVIGAAGGPAATVGGKGPPEGTEIPKSARGEPLSRSSQWHQHDKVDQSNRGTRRAEERVNPSNTFSINSTFHTLPIFASGSAFVPTAVDTILSNCFFDPMVPLMCERLLCGQKHKTMVQIDLPPSFAGRNFGDLYRTFLSKNLMVLALRRAASLDDHSLLPYVYTCPQRSVELKINDRLFVYCSPVELDFAIQKCDGFNISYNASSQNRSWMSKAALLAEECFVKTSFNKRLQPFSGRPTAFDIKLSAKFRALRPQADQGSVSEPGSPAGGQDGEGSDCAEEM